MKFYSTTDRNHEVSLQEAVMSGMAPQGGLYMPERIPLLDQGILHSFAGMSFQEIALEISKQFVQEDIPVSELEPLVYNAMDLDMEIHRLDEHTSVLETWHGPTMAFKDVGARFMARIMSHFLKGSDQKLTILVATSGDTGSAVASGFFQVPGIEVVILYPSGKVSPSQEKQLTTQGENITALEIDGTFDDCQHLVKAAFADDDLRKAHQLSSANSINIARLLPQSFYYAFAASRLSDQGSPFVVSVPCGNFGNLTAGLFAQRMGVPIDHFVASTNRNDVFPEYLKSGEYEPRSSAQTISNAMDVGNPSNLARIQDLFDQNLQQMRSSISSYSFSDEQTRAMIKSVDDRFGYVIDPHTAVGMLGLDAFRAKGPKSQGLVISTAHPAKFPESVEPEIGRCIEVPPQLAQYLGREKQATSLGNTYPEFREYLLETLH